MKKIVILHSYPNTARHINVLSECIDIFKKTEYDVLLVSHYPVPAEIYKKADYYLFDTDNSMLPGGQFLTQHFFDINGHRAILAYEGHALAITRSMRKAISFVKGIGYDFFWFSEADCLLSEPDLEKLNNLYQKMIDEDKNMIYFKPADFKDERHDSHVYETLLFGGDPSYFLARFKPPTTLEEWLSMNMDPMLEYSFYSKFKDHEEDYIIINDHSSNYFNDSQINIFRYNQFVCELLNNGSSDNITLFLTNAYYNKFIYNTITKINGVEIDNRFFCKGCWYYNNHPLDGSLLEIEIYEDEMYSHTKTFLLTKDTLSSLKGTFKLI
jgi:hypothetical protein